MVNVSPEIGHSIKIRCHIQWIAVGSTSVPALLVREKYDHVGLFRHNVGSEYRDISYIRKILRR